MINLIYDMPQHILRLIIDVIVIGALLLGAHVVKRYCKINNEDNEAINGATATVSMMYAIFIGFVIFFTLNNFTAAQESSETEARLVSSINYEAAFLPKPLNTQVRQILKNYLEVVINEEWPAMREGVVNTAGAVPLTQLQEVLLNYQPENTDAVKINIWTDIVQNADILFQEHESRMDYAQNLSLDRGVWYCLIAATFVMLVSNLFLSFNSRRTKIVLLICIGAITSLLLFLETSMDYPYRGHYSVNSEVFSAVLKQMNH